MNDKYWPACALLKMLSELQLISFVYGSTPGGEVNAFTKVMTMARTY